MSSLKFIEIDGRRYLWSHILELRRQQRRAYRNTQQPALFELKHDCRPPSERTAGGRFHEPSLFECRRPS